MYDIHTKNPNTNLTSVCTSEGRIWPFKTNYNFWSKLLLVHGKQARSLCTVTEL